MIMIPQISHLGGAERLSYELSMGLAEKGVQVDVLNVHALDTSTEKYLELKQKVRQVLELGLPVHSSMLQFLNKTLALRKILKVGKYDAVEAITVTSMLMVILASIWMKTTVVIGVHQTYRKDRHTSKKLLLLRLLLKIKRQKKLYAISDYTADAWHVYAGGQRPEVLYNSIHHSFFEDDAADDHSGLTAQNSPYILYVGRIAEYKNVEVLVYAFSSVLKRCPECHLILAGADEMNRVDIDMRERVQRYITDCDLSDKIKFTGHIPSAKQLMRDAAVMVHPTRVEGFGLVLIEALAAKTMFVTTDAEAIPEVLDGARYTCVPLAKLSAETLSDAIVHTLSIPKAEVAEIKTHNYAYAETFTTERRVQQFFTMIAQ